MGALNAVDPVRQGAQGIEDSVEKFITQTYEGGHEVGDMELITYMCENALTSVEWMESIGVEFKPEVGTATGGFGANKALLKEYNTGVWAHVDVTTLGCTNMAKSATGASIENMVAQGSVIEADTLEELAEKTGMDAAKLTASIDNYNAVVRGEKEDKLGFQANNKADVEMTEGPWYACKKVPTVHHTMGGLKINVNTQVLWTRTATSFQVCTRLAK